MTERPGLPPRRAALDAAVSALPDAAPRLPVAVAPISSQQWRRSLEDANLTVSVAKYADLRHGLSLQPSSNGRALGQKLRQRAIEFAAAATDVCGRLEALAALEPGVFAAPQVAHAWRESLVEDATAVVGAIISEASLPSLPAWPSLPDVPIAERDVVQDTFGLAASEASDDAGQFCDTRVLAHYRLRLPALADVCRPILELVCARAPSVFTATSAARDLVTSASPWTTLRGARQIRTLILESYAKDPTQATSILAEAADEADKEWTAFDRLTDRLRQAETARARARGTERAYAVAVLEAYKHMAEGLIRRWVWTLLRLSGLRGPEPTLGVLVSSAQARLGEIGSRLEAALVPALRNAEAHDDFAYDEDSGLLIIGAGAFAVDDIVGHLAELDTLQRAMTIGRLAAFSDEPALAGDANEQRGPGAASAMMMARQRFGHAGQRLRSFVRDRDRLDIEVDDLKPEACNPCFLALTQASQCLPTVGRFVVSVSTRSDPIIDVTGVVLHENWKVLVFALAHFPDSLPQVTFLPALTWSRLSTEAVGQAARVAAWMALNDAQHAIVDAQAAPRESARLQARLLLVYAAASSTIRLLPPGPHVAELSRAQSMARGAAKALPGAGDVAIDLLLDRVLLIRDRIGGPPAVLPRLDPTPIKEGAYPHTVS